MRQKQAHVALHLASVVCCGCLLAGCDQAGKATSETDSRGAAKAASRQEQNTAQEPMPSSPPIVSAARAQVGKTMIYDPSYIRLHYPGGDVPIERGVCSDVVVRALRDALGMDLQKLVHEDMRAAFPEYPKIWGLKSPDPNIDHRRVPNLQRYFERKGYSLPVTKEKRDFLPGDLVTCTVPPSRPHIMVVSDRRSSDGIPLVIHNVGSGTKEENRLLDFPLTGHYRIGTDGSSKRIERDR
ncbi:MAG: DUF1287 domain-containing protein [Planctomycetes bacterium]|nr:DUF1287 domain-containing protein [Planctomycetota bacterium]